MRDWLSERPNSSRFELMMALVVWSLVLWPIFSGAHP